MRTLIESRVDITPLKISIDRKGSTLEYCDKEFSETLHKSMLKDLTENTEYTEELFNYSKGVGMRDTGDNLEEFIKSVANLCAEMESDLK